MRQSMSTFSFGCCRQTIVVVLVDQVHSGGPGCVGGQVLGVGRVRAVRERTLFGPERQLVDVRRRFGRELGCVRTDLGDDHYCSGGERYCRYSVNKNSVDESSGDKLK